MISKVDHDDYGHYEHRPEEQTDPSSSEMWDQKNNKCADDRMPRRQQIITSSVSMYALPQKDSIWELVEIFHMGEAVAGAICELSREDRTHKREWSDQTVCEDDHFDALNDDPGDWGADVLRKPVEPNRIPLEQEAERKAYQREAEDDISFVRIYHQMTDVNHTREIFV